MSLPLSPPDDEFHMPDGEDRDDDREPVEPDDDRAFADGYGNVGAPLEYLTILNEQNL